MNVFDIETELISPQCKEPEPVAIGVFDGESKIVLPHDFCIPEGEIVNHNIEFDFRVLWVHRPDLRDALLAKLDTNSFLCTKILARLIAIENGSLQDFNRRNQFSLAACLERELGINIWAEKKDPKSWRMRFSELKGLPLAFWPEAAKQYIFNDILLPKTLLEHYRANVSQDLVEHAKIQTSRECALGVFSINGVNTNAKKLKDLRLMLEIKKEQALTHLVHSGLAKINKTNKQGFSTKKAEIQRLVFESLGDKTPYTAPTDRYPQGQIRTDFDTLVITANPTLQAYASCKKYSTYITKYVDSMSGRIHPSYKVLLASGRATAYDPCIMQLPKFGGFRESMEADTGYMFVYADYSQLELFSFAQILIDLGITNELMRKVNSKDLHVEIVEHILGRKYDASTDKKWRHLAKGINYGKPGGMGLATLSKIINKVAEEPYSMDRIQQFSDAYDKLNPWTKEFHKYCKRLVQANQWVSWKRIPRRRAAIRFCATCNTFFQGLASDGVLDACTQSIIDSRLAGSKPFGYIYDEIVLQSPLALCESHARALRDIMLEQMSKYLPDATGLGVDVSIDNVWSKSAEKYIFDNDDLDELIEE